MEGEELRLRQRFLARSRQTLADRLAELNEEFRREVLRVSEGIAEARQLRGESRQAPHELVAQAEEETEAMSQPAKQRLAQMAREESQAIKELTYRAVCHPVKGKRLRELLGEIKRAEQRLGRLDRDLAQLVGSGMNLPTVERQGPRRKEEY